MPPDVPDPNAGLRASVVVATFDGEQHLPEQLRSLVEQRRPPDEVVVVDDASSDGTMAIVERFAASAPFPVEVVRHDAHRGTSATFAEGLARAAGDVLLYCDQDDRWHPDKVAVVVERMAAQPDALLAFSDSHLVDVDGRQTHRSRWWLAGFGPRQVQALERDPLGLMLARQVVAGCTAAIRRELLPALLPFPEGVHPALGDMVYDRWTSLLAAAAGPVLAIDVPLLDYRIHRAQQIGIPGLPLRRVAPRAVLHLAQLRVSAADTSDRADYHRAHLDEIEKRLTAAGLAGPSALRHLQAARDHLALRASLVGARHRRVRPVTAHLRDRDGYRRFSLGVSTALADLVR